MHRPLSRLAGLLLLGSCTPAAEPEPLSAPPAPLSTALRSAPGVTRIDLGTLGGPSSYATDVNDAGVVVGWSELSAGSRMAFGWTRAGGMQPLPLLPGFTESMAISITPRGDILGRTWSSGRDSGVDIVWSAAGGILRLGIPNLPGSTGSFAGDRNDAGEVVGAAFVQGFSHYWIWSQRQGILDITLDIPNGRETYAGNINRHGVVVGTNADCDPACNYRVFLWTRTHGYRPLGLAGELPLRETQGLGSVNDRGVVAGWVDPNGNTNPVPFVWRAASGFTLLPIFPSNWHFGYAMAVNLSGTVVGASASREHDEAIQAAAWPGGGSIINLNGTDPNPSIALVVNRLGLAAGWSALRPRGGLNHATAWIIAPGTVGMTPEPDPAGTGREAGSPPPAMTGIEGCLARVARIPTREALLDCVSHPTD